MREKLKIAWTQGYILLALLVIVSVLCWQFKPPEPLPSYSYGFMDCALIYFFCKWAIVDKRRFLAVIVGLIGCYFISPKLFDLFVSGFVWFGGFLAVYAVVGCFMGVVVLLLLPFYALYRRDR